MTKMEQKIRRKFVFAYLFLALFGIISFAYFCPENACVFPSEKPRYSGLSAVIEGDTDKQNLIQSNSLFDTSDEANHIDYNKISFKAPTFSFDDILNDNSRFDINNHDVIVFLHIQKTGGTMFGRHLVQDLDLQRPCTCKRKQKRCFCFRPNKNENWLFSRYSTGWKCGLHADWTELTNCVDYELVKNEGEAKKRRYFYITLIREPIKRFLSEFKHVQRGATWKNSRHWCNGRNATAEELPKCYPNDTWINVTLHDFLNCPYNLAFNRQTRMMSDLSLVGCYNKSVMTEKERNRIMLQSAKRNLESMAFFALTEFQKEGQYLFEETFNFRFAVQFTQYNSTRSSGFVSKLTPEQMRKIREVNELDLELYKFSKQLMFKRFKKMRSKDKDFNEHWKHLGELQVQSEFNWNEEIEPNPVTANNT